MAQKDIEDIAIYMRQIDESKNAEQKAFDESCKECDDLQLKEDENFEDEIIDKTSLGFIDDSDFEDDESKPMNEAQPIKKDLYKNKLAQLRKRPFEMVIDFCYDETDENLVDAPEYEKILSYLDKAITEVCAEAKLPQSVILSRSIYQVSGPGGGWPEVGIVINNYDNAIKFGKAWYGTDDVEDVAFLLHPVKSAINETEATEEVDPLDEDVSDCLVQDSDLDESEDQGSIIVQVYNEDGFGAHFADEVQKYVPTVSVSTLKHKLPNGDLEVSISGNVEDLKKAYAFYIGKEDFSKVSPEDKDEFNSLLVYRNGDTIAEADYREAVAHCLDPIGVDASTANLVDKDTCAISFVKEEKAKRLFNKMKTCLQENDASALSDDELEAIDNVTDAIKNDEDYENLSKQNQALMKLIVGEMGYTLDDWNKLTPEAKDKAWKDFEQKTKLNKSGFADTKNQFIVRNPETGEKEITAFNPNYTSDDSTYQHPSAVKRHVRELAALKDQNDKRLKSIEAIKKARGKKNKETWDMQEFYDIISPLDSKERKQLMKDLIADIEKDNADDPKKAGNEIMFIKELFNQKLTLRDFAKAWGATAPGVMKYHDNIIAIWKDTCREFGVDPDLPTGRAKFVKLIANPVTFEKFKTRLRQNLDARKKGRLVKGL